MTRYATFERAESRDELEHLGRLSHWLDNLIRLPGGYRIGLDGIIGLIPGVGDAAGALVSAYIVAQAARLGVPTGTLVKMIGNVALETVLGPIPVVGDLFDFAWKANARNVALLEREQGRSSRGEAGNKRLLWLVYALVALVLLALVVLVWAFIELLFALAAA